MIELIAQNIEIPLIVGGIVDLRDIQKAYNQRRLVVIGTAFEKMNFFLK
jgi:phosphoribosylformimino-5-aminoimidazole carboxamide ribonucleotide (ProFAR) isomerase